jgi:hypothetical protein
MSLKLLSLSVLQLLQYEENIIFEIMMMMMMTVEDCMINKLFTSKNRVTHREGLRRRPRRGLRVGWAALS